MAWIHVAGAALGLAAVVPNGRAYACTFEHEKQLAGHRRVVAAPVPGRSDPLWVAWQQVKSSRVNTRGRRVLAPVRRTGTYGIFPALRLHSDASVMAGAEPVPAGVNQPLTLWALANNRAPNEALDPRLTMTIPPQLAFVSAWASQGKCSYRRGTVSCRLGHLPAEQEIPVRIQTQTVSAGLATSTAAVQHLGEDPVPSNDTAAFSFDVQP